MKKGQEEIVGFVLIMVIVVVILVVFLGISLRSGQVSERESTDIYQFLESVGEVTSGCQTRSNEYADIGELYEKCYSKEECLNNASSCEVLEKEFNEIMAGSWNVGENASIKGYRLSSAYKSNEEAESEEIFRLEEGNCGASRRGASYLTPAFPGRITTILELCY